MAAYPFTMYYFCHLVTLVWKYLAWPLNPPWKRHEQTGRHRPTSDSKISVLMDISQLCCSVNVTTPTHTHQKENNNNKNPANKQKVLQNTQMQFCTSHFLFSRMALGAPQLRELFLLRVKSIRRVWGQLCKRLTFICFINSNICSGGKLATALDMASGAFSGSTGSPNGDCNS